jgi:hypothetical protein
MKAIQNTAVATRFDGYPSNVRKKLLHLRALILTTATKTSGVGEIEETLKWGEPAYVTAETGSGSTIRIDWKNSKPDQYAMYFNCNTNLVETFRRLFPNDFAFDGNRALVFKVTEVVPHDALTICIAAALTYHRAKPGSPKVNRPSTDAVGTGITPRPPHRSVRAELPHTAPASGADDQPPPK